MEYVKHEAEKVRAELDEELAEKRNKFEQEHAEAVSEVTSMYETIARMSETLTGEVDSMDAKITRIVDEARINISNLSVAVSGAKDKIAEIRSKLPTKE